LTGCKQLQGVSKAALTVAEQNPELMRNMNEKDRGTLVSGLKAANAMLAEIDTAEEIAIGQSMAVRTFAAFGPPCKDAALQRYVAMVGNLVALQSERPSLPYSFVVVDNGEQTALALPGGFVFVSVGLLRQLHSESELAAVLAHEVSHVAQKHGLEVVLRDRRIGSLVDFAAQMDKDVAKYRDFIDGSYNKLAHEGYDQGYEIKADLAGTRYAYRAGYHPEGLLPFLEMTASSGSKVEFEMFKTHPDPRTRISEIRGELRSFGNYALMPKIADRYSREAGARVR
jgi:predicted Zn-dependent protease